MHYTNFPSHIIFYLARVCLGLWGGGPVPQIAVAVIKSLCGCMCVCVVCVCVSVGFYAFILVRMYKMQGCVLRGWFSTCVSAFRVSVWYACAMRIFMHLHGHIHVHALQHFAFQVVTGLPTRHGLRFVNCRRMPLRTCAARRSLMYNCGRLASTSEAMRYGAPRSRWLLRCGASCGLA